MQEDLSVGYLPVTVLYVAKGSDVWARILTGDRVNYSSLVKLMRNALCSKANTQIV